MDIFEIVIASIMGLLVLGVGTLYFIQYRKLVKESDKNSTVSIDLLLNSCADDLIDIIATALEINSIKREDYDTDIEYKMAVSKVVSKDVIKFLDEKSNIPKPILDALTDEAISKVIFKVVDYIEVMQSNKKEKKIDNDKKEVICDDDNPIIDDKSCLSGQVDITKELEDFIEE